MRKAMDFHYVAISVYVYPSRIRFRIVANRIRLWSSPFGYVEVRLYRRFSIWFRDNTEKSQTNFQQARGSGTGFVSTRRKVPIKGKVISADDHGLLRPSYHWNIPGHGLIHQANN